MLDLDDALVSMLVSHAVLWLRLDELEYTALTDLQGTHGSRGGVTLGAGVRARSKRSKRREERPRDQETERDIVGHLP